MTVYGESVCPACTAAWARAAARRRPPGREALFQSVPTFAEATVAVVEQKRAGWKNPV